MTVEGDSFLERVQSSYLQLSAVASDLNVVSDELGKSVAELDSALKKLNLGITVWATVRSDDRPDYGWFRSEDIGYGKIDGKWGISLRTVNGNYDDPEGERIEQWLFNDAPRSLRLAAIGKIPDLLEELSKKAVETTQEIKNKLAEAQEVAAIVKRAAEPPRQVRRIISRPIGQQEQSK